MAPQYILLFDATARPLLYPGNYAITNVTKVTSCAVRRLNSVSQGGHAARCATNGWNTSSLLHRTSASTNLEWCIMPINLHHTPAPTSTPAPTPHCCVALRCVALRCMQVGRSLRHHTIYATITHTILWSRLEYDTTRGMYVGMYVRLFLIL